MFDPENPSHISNLTNAVNWSKQQREPFLETRAGHRQQFVGADYGEDSAQEAVPINMIDLYINTMQRFICSHDPQAMVGSKYNELLPAANDLELALNMEAERINLRETFRTWTTEALFRMGIVEVGITAEDTPPDGEGNLYDPGKLFVDPILLDKFIPDFAAPDWDLMAYACHDYSVPIEWAQENPAFDEAVRKRITAPNREEVEQEYNSENVVGNRAGLQELEPMIVLRQVYLYREKLLLRFVVGADLKEPLQFVKWMGPERGPYHPLCFGKVPGSIMPNAPVPQLAPLHDQINTLWNKVTRQADRQKTVLLVRGAAGADGQRIVNTNDGDAMYSEDPGGAVEQSFGGADPRTLATALQAKDIADWRAGNISALAGLAAQSETVGQDKLLAANASGQPQDLQQITLQGQKGVFESMAFWLYNDPISEYHIVKQIGNSNETFTYVWGPEERMGDLTKFNFSVDPFSAVVQSPSEALNTYMQALTTLLIPGEPGMQQQGMGLDWEYIVKTISRLSNRPEIRRSIRFVQGEAYPERQHLSGDRPGMAPNTTRTNVRVNKPAATMAGKEQVLVHALMGAGSQPSEQAALIRPGV